MINVCNFTRPSGDSPALLRLEEVETLFHEFGHGLHSLLSRIHYKSLASVPRDFVELPSQIMENWALEPEVLKVYAKHYKTGAVIPDELVAKIKKAEKFNQGFADRGVPGRLVPRYGLAYVTAAKGGAAGVRESGPR